MFKIALCQMMGSGKSECLENKNENYIAAAKMIAEAASNGAKIVCLPEIWNCPYSNDFFAEYAETAEGITVQKMSLWAKENDIYLIGGSIPEKTDDGKIYNTCFVFDRNGEIIARHRKYHLFDVDIEGGIKFKESETFTAGDSLTVFDTEYGKVGVAICFDVRFSEVFKKMALDGAKLIFLPAAFNMTTGPAHWDITMRMRAVDNQVYFAACSPARNEDGVYVAYGNSCVADPWGTFIAHAAEKEEIVYADIDFDYVDAIRKQLPILVNSGK